MSHTAHIMLSFLIAVVVAAITLKILVGIAILAIWFAMAAVKFAIFAVVALIIFGIVYMSFRRGQGRF
jgi:hypothetical protein